MAFIFSYHPDISGSERGTSFGIQIVADNQTLYKDPEKDPFWIIQYSPIYFYLVGKIYRVLNEDPTNIFRIQFLSRFISFIFVSISIGATYVTLRKVLSVPRVMSIICCCILFGQLQQWHLTNGRIDSLLFLCTVTFIYLILRAFEEKKEWNIYLVLATLVGVTAFFTKQSGMIHCVVLPVYFLYRFQWSSFFKTLGLTILFGTLITVIFSNLEFKIFFNNLFGSLDLPIVPGWFYSYTFKHLIPDTSLLIGVSFIICFKWLGTSTDSKTTFLALATFLFFAFASLTALKHGAAVGYYHEFAFVGLIGIFYYFYKENMASTRSSIGYYLIPALSVITMIFFTSRQIEKYYYSPLEKYKHDYIQQKKVKDYVSERILPDEKVVISGGEDFRGWPLQHMLFRHILAYQEPEVRFLYESKRFNYNGFFELVKNGKIRYLILDKGSPPFFHAFNYTFDLAQYALESEIDGYRIYRLKR